MYSKTGRVGHPGSEYTCLDRMFDRMFDLMFDRTHIMEHCGGVEEVLREGVLRNLVLDVSSVLRHPEQMRVQHRLPSSGRACVRAIVRACVRACVCAYACVCVCVCVYMHDLT